MNWTYRLPSSNFHAGHVGLSSSSEQEDKPKLQLHAAVTEPVVQASDLLNAS